MININEKVSVSLLNNIPQSVFWRNKDYKVIKVGLHHTYFEGKKLIHIFSVLTSSIFMRLKLNSTNLLWNLEEVSENNFY